MGAPYIYDISRLRVKWQKNVEKYDGVPFNGIQFYIIQLMVTFLPVNPQE
jgi:hypothetical protein